MNRKDLDARIILPKGWNYLTVLDFEVARIFQYELGIWTDKMPSVDYEEYLTSKGHNLKNCEWMIHDNSELITN